MFAHRSLIVLLLLAVLAGWSIALPNSAVAQSTIDTPLPDPEMESRARALHKLLRCLVCQNQSIDDSNAPLARDLRVLVRDRLAKGETDEETIAYVVDRYGDWVLLDPPFKLRTLALWVGPLIIFLVAAGGVFLVLRRRQAAPAGAPAPLTEAEKARLDKLLDDGDGDA